jgi:hypothetical protein
MRLRLVGVTSTTDERITRDTTTPEVRAWEVLDDDDGGTRVARIHEELDASKSRSMFVLTVFDRIGRGTEAPEGASRSVEEAVAARTERGRDFDEGYPTLEEAVAAVEVHRSGHAPPA